MNITARPARPLTGERGMALISALLLLLVISLLAVGLSMDTSMDVRLAGYQRVKARSFGFAESGLMASADILETNFFDSGWDNDIPFEFPGLSDQYVGTLNIVNDGDFYMQENIDGETTMVMTGDINAEVIVQSLGSQFALGAALQSHAGYAGIGKGAGGGGGLHRLYNIEATGTDADNVRSTVAMTYRVVN